MAWSSTPQHPSQHSLFQHGNAHQVPSTAEAGNNWEIDSAPTEMWLSAAKSPGKYKVGNSSLQAAAVSLSANEKNMCKQKQTETEKDASLQSKLLKHP